MSIPLHKVTLQTNLVSDTVMVGVRPSLPIRGVDLILGNDLAVIASPRMLKDPEKLPHTAVEDQIIYPACAVTRAMAKRMLTEESNDEETMWWLPPTGIRRNDCVMST